MRRLVLALAGRTYHIFGNLMSWLNDHLFINPFQTNGILHRGSYMCSRVLLNLLNALRKRDEMRGLPSILSLSLNDFENADIFNIYH